MIVLSPEFAVYEGVQETISLYAQISRTGGNARMYLSYTNATGGSLGNSPFFGVSSSGRSTGVLTITNVKDGRHHIAVEYEASKSVIFIMDGVELDRVTPAQTKGGAFPTSPMKAYIEVWPSLSEGWAGKWQGAGSGLTMTVHGFKQS